MAQQNGHSNQSGIVDDELYAQRVYAAGTLIDDSMCVPIKAAGGKMSIICL